MEKINIVRATLNENQIDLLVSEIQKTVNITGYTKKEWAHFNTIFIAYYEQNFAGVCVNISINNQWEELAVLFVLPQFQGKGIGTLLFETGLHAILSEGKKAYTTSRNELVITMMKQQKFQFVPLKKLPLSIQFFNLRFVLSSYRIQEFFRKKMYSSKLPEFMFGVKE